MIKNLFLFLILVGSENDSLKYAGSISSVTKVHQEEKSTPLNELNDSLKVCWLLYKLKCFVDAS